MVAKGLFVPPSQRCKTVDWPNLSSYRRSQPKRTVLPNWHTSRASGRGLADDKIQHCLLFHDCRPHYRAFTKPTDSRHICQRRSRSTYPHRRDISATLSWPPVLLYSSRTKFSHASKVYLLNWWSSRVFSAQHPTKKRIDWRRTSIMCKVCNKRLISIVRRNIPRNIARRKRQGRMKPLRNGKLRPVHVGTKRCAMGLSER